jgi:hypothetical protein
MKGHSPERAALTFSSGKERTPWHVHPSVNPSCFHVSASPFELSEHAARTKSRF